MIVRRTHGSIQLITQPEHAHLAGRIMEHCVPLAGCTRRPSILRAIAEHDNGWEETDAAPLVDPATGAIADFVTAPLSVRHGVWPRAVTRLADDRWAAALVAHHALTVYDRFRPDPAWTRFFDDMAVARDTRLGDLSLADLVADYPFLRLGDLISLAFCTGSRDEMRFAEWTVQLTGQRVVVTPDVFGGATIPFEVPTREMHDRVFRADEELRDVMRSAKTLMLRGEVAGGQC